MSLPIIANDKQYSCPICWEETTTGQYQRVKALKEPNELSVLCALIDADFEMIAETTSDEIEGALYQCTSFVFNQAEYFRDKPAPTHFKLGDGTVLVPTKLGSLTIMQNLVIRQHMNKRCLEELISIAVAVYLQPFVDSVETGKKAPFNLDRAKEIEKDVLKMPIEKTFPVGFFYLSKLNNFGRFGLLEWCQRLAMKMSYVMRLHKKQA